jgi:Flp pilus assembly protein TadD
MTPLHAAVRTATFAVVRAGSLAVALAVLAVEPAAAADTESTPVANVENRDYAAGRRAVERKNWPEAVERFRRAVSAEPNNADAHNMLGYSLRWSGQMDQAFASYDRALQIDPKHRGALQYSGIASIRTGNLARAEQNLGKLKDLCGVNCTEYKELAQALADARAGKR